MTHHTHLHVSFVFIATHILHSGDPFQVKIKGPKGDVPANVTDNGYVGPLIAAYCWLT